MRVFNNCAASLGGNGGGVINITAGDTVLIDGIINANGASGAKDGASGGQEGQSTFKHIRGKDQEL